MYHGDVTNTLVLQTCKQSAFGDITSAHQQGSLNQPHKTTSIGSYSIAMCSVMQVIYVA